MSNNKALELLTVHHLQRTIIERAQRNHETYKDLYSIVHRRIERAFTADTSVTRLQYQVPAFKPDRPKYDPRRAARYIRDKLRRGGFDVRVGEDGVTIHIDWSASARLGAAVLKQPQQPPPRQQQQRRLTRDDMASRLHALKQKLHAG